MANSQGDPRVLFAMNLVLSSVFAYAVVWGLAFLEMLAFSWITVASVAVLLMALTYLVIQ
ncbi:MULTISPECIES: hypothetical protein [Halorussus]|uniref:hypothetical protein n=1 Tax=Halorussus TaxID=1070314 RepID=UPI00209EABEB|nr:hypothetical protein [Halorussus vallis]USZ74078.1 hypothetical protein NGM07_11490 [Halorussus vallis]